jgi:hypothetical protein
MRFSAQVEKLITKLKVYEDPESVAELERQLAQIQHMLDAIGCGSNGGDKESK